MILVDFSVREDFDLRLSGAHSVSLRQRITAETLHGLTFRLFIKCPWLE